jgi:putative hydrolase of the HAD superfamily
MKRSAPITALFLDIGGVLLTDGWDHHARKRAAKHFKLDWAEMEERHHLNFDTYEEGQAHASGIFRPGGLLPKAAVHPAEFRRFMFAQSKPYPEMIELVRKLKAKFGLKIAVVSNEARELNAYRIRKFKLDGFVDAFVSSCFVHLRKPDADIFQAGAGHRPGASPADRLYRKHPDVRPDRGRFGDSKHSSHGLQIHVRETGFVGIAE